MTVKEFETYFKVWDFFHDCSRLALLMVDLSENATVPQDFPHFLLNPITCLVGTMLLQLTWESIGSLPKANTGYQMLEIPGMVKKGQHRLPEARKNPGIQKKSDKG